MLSNNQIQEILEEIKLDPRVRAILLTGSYVYGHPTDESDLDVRVVTDPGTEWMEKYRIRFEHNIELFCNPAEKIRGYFDINRREGKAHAIHFWTYGKIVYDPTGIAKELQNEAAQLLKLGPYTGTWEESLKHGIRS